jgi:tetratricopeptide (TPR) repeat protein
MQAPVSGVWSKPTKSLPHASIRIAVLLSQHTFYSQAAMSFQRIATLDPTWDNRYNLALALLYDQQPAEACALLAALHTERPAHADTLMFLGSAFEMQQKMPEALDAYRAALVADPSNPDRTLDYTRLLMDMDRYDEAIQVVRTGIGDTSSTALNLRLGAVEMIKGDYPAARAAFHAALDVDANLTQPMSALLRPMPVRARMLTESKSLKRRVRSSPITIHWSITLACWPAAWAASRRRSLRLKTQCAWSRVPPILSSNSESSTARNRSGHWLVRPSSMSSH